MLRLGLICFRFYDCANVYDYFNGHDANANAYVNFYDEILPFFFIEFRFNNFHLPNIFYLYFFLHNHYLVV